MPSDPAEPLLTAVRTDAPAGTRKRNALLALPFVLAGTAVAWMHHRGHVISPQELWFGHPRSEGVCSTGPVGTCAVMGCIAGRNSVCHWPRCMCRPNFCAKEKSILAGGTCELPNTTWHADVARVDESQPTFPAPHNAIETAVCLSGGGARAASMTLGVVRALENLGLMRNVDAISSISGSTFVSIPYMFGNGSMYVEQNDGGLAFWGSPTDPRSLTLAVLDRTPPPLAAPWSNAHGGTWGTIEALPHFLGHLSSSRGHRTAQWRELILTEFLKPFGLDDKDCFMAGSAEAAARIKAANPQLATFCFQTLQPGRPKVFVIGAALLAPSGEDQHDATSFQISPDFAGTPFHQNIQHRPLYTSATADAPLSDAIVGGGLVETFGFGGNAPRDQSGGPTDLPSPHRPFTLADAMSVATYADFLPGDLGVLHVDWTPAYKYWPVGAGSEPARYFMVGDGGFIEDTGLLAMLQRQAKRIALFMFVGPGQGLSPDVDFCDLAAQIEAGTFDFDSFEASGKLADSMYTIFGYGYDDGMWHKSHNQAFERKDMFPVACDLQTLQSQGKPLVLKRKHLVRPNAYWGIRAYTVEMIYFYNAKSAEFESLLPAETQAALQGGMKGFPTDLPAGLYLRPRVIQLMAAHSEYAVVQNADLYRELFSRS